MTLDLKRQILWFVLQNTLNSGILTINPFCILILIGEQKEYFFRILRQKPSMFYISLRFSIPSLDLLIDSLRCHTWVLPSYLAKMDNFVCQLQNPKAFWRRSTSEIIMEYRTKWWDKGFGLSDLQTIDFKRIQLCESFPMDRSAKDIFCLWEKVVGNHMVNIQHTHVA